MKLLIQPVDGRSVMLVDDNGRTRPGRYAGRDAAGKPLAEDEIVNDCDHYRRAARRGDLVIVEEVVS